MNKDELLATLTRDSRITIEEKANSSAIKVPPEALLEIAGKLKNDYSLAFNVLLSNTAVHWIADNEFELLYRLYSTTQRHHLLLTTRVSVDNPIVASLASVWRVAEWQEREVYDLYGVLYQGHPDLRRILLEDDWKGYPLRKDYKDDFMLEGP